MSINNLMDSLSRMNFTNIKYNVKQVFNENFTSFTQENKPPKSEDKVNHPSHYTNGLIECIDAIEAATMGLVGIEAVCVGNVIKYVWRWKFKNGLEDLKKARWYLDKLITKIEKETVERKEMLERNG